jgi:hypothetical protein
VVTDKVELNDFRLGRRSSTASGWQQDHGKQERPRHANSLGYGAQGRGHMSVYVDDPSALGVSNPPWRTEAVVVSNPAQPFSVGVSNPPQGPVGVSNPPQDSDVSDIGNKLPQSC